MFGFRCLAAGVGLFVFTAMPAYAYLDPVTGTFLIQGLIAGVAACLAGIRSVRQRVVAFFASVFSRKDK